MADIKYRIGLGTVGVGVNTARPVDETKIFTADKAKPEAPSGGFPFRFTADSTFYTADGSKPI